MKKFLVMFTASVFGMLVLINALIFYFVLRDPASYVTNIAAWVAAGVLSVIISYNYWALNRGSGNTLGSYLKRIWIVAFLVFMASEGFSLVCGMITTIVLPLFKIGTDDFFLNGAFAPFIVFAVYLFGMYKNMIRLGFQDANRRKFNLNLKILTMFLVLILIMPATFSSNAYSTFYTDSGLFINFRSVFSFKVNLIGSAVDSMYEEFNIIIVTVKVLLTFAIEMAVAVFAYSRGKKLFLEQRISKDDGYQTDEISDGQ